LALPDVDAPGRVASTTREGWVLSGPAAGRSGSGEPVDTVVLPAPTRDVVYEYTASTASSTSGVTGHVKGGWFGRRASMRAQRYCALDVHQSS
jgi:hypothetical protein